MKTYRTFEISDEDMKLLGIVNCKLDEDDSSIFKKIKRLGLEVTKRRNKLVWWDDDYIEIINKKTDLTIGVMEVLYR